MSKIDKYRESLSSQVKTPDTLVVKSKLNEWIPDRAKLEIYKAAIGGGDNTETGRKIEEILHRYNVDFQTLGTGTNRFGLKIDRYCVKVALDYDGLIDNKREFEYSPRLGSGVTETYEMDEMGLFLVCEYVRSMTAGEFAEYRSKIKEILDEIQKYFLIGDIGITTKNYGNFGIRLNGEVVIIDYAYVYNVNSDVFRCKKDMSNLEYDSNYEYLICPECGSRYSFIDIRRKITRKMQEDELKNVSEYGYRIHGEEELTVVPDRRFVPELFPPEKKQKAESDYDRVRREYLEKKAEEDRLIELLSGESVTDDEEDYEY